MFGSHSLASESWLSIWVIHVFNTATIFHVFCISGPLHLSACDIVFSLFVSPTSTLKKFYDYSFDN